MGDVTDEDRVRLREDLQFARALHSLAEKEVGELRAKCAAFAEENAQLRALASRLSSVEMFENICPIARPRDEGARDEGAGAKRARDEDARECVVQCGEDGEGSERADPGQRE